MAVVYLHIGMPKTGTSSIQKFLYLNQVNLNKHDYSYPDFLFKYERIASNRNAHFLCDNMDDKADSNFWTGIQKVIAETKKYSNIIISDETIWNAQHINPKIIKNFWKELKNAGIEFKIIVYLRRQDQYAMSCWNQMIKKSKRNMSYKEYVAKKMKNKALDYYDHLCDISDIVGKENLIVRIYEAEQFLDSDLFTDFLNIFSLSMKDGFVPLDQNVNLSLNGNFTEIKRRLAMMKEYRNFAGDPVFEVMKKFPEKYHKRPNMISGEEQYEYMLPYLDGNKKVAIEFLGREEGRLFYQETDRNSQKWILNQEDIMADSLRIICALIEEKYEMSEEYEQLVDQYKSESVYVHIKRKIVNIIRAIKEEL